MRVALNELEGLFVGMSAVTSGLEPPLLELELRDNSG